MEKLTGHLGRIAVGDGFPVRLVGIINLSPESFYGGSVVSGVDEALKVGIRMVEDGAEALDVGSMSTAPYLRTIISEDEEIRRLVPVVKALAQQLDVPISADTQRAKVAEVAVKAGATIINDISGRTDSRMLKVSATYGTSMVILPKDLPYRVGPLQATIDSLRTNLNAALEAGVQRSKVLLDPGIGFLRKGPMPWHERDSLVLANLESMRELGRPIFIGVSRKSFIGELLGLRDPAKRLCGSLSATAVAVFNGAHVVRTHDIAETEQVVRLAEELKKHRR